MKFLQLINGTGWEVIVALSISNLLAQIIKTVLFAIKRGQVNLALMVSTGGMPSSHSSTVTAMATSVGLIDGWTSTTFAIAACISGIVMYDAAGVRRSASLQARALNQIISELLSKEHKLNKEKLKEFLGHTRTEVLAGALLGICISFGLRYLMITYL